MKILQIHNEYAFPGGEDAAAEAEARMLRRAGHEVAVFRKNNREVESASLLQKLSFLSGGFLDSRKVYEEISSLVSKSRPDVAHFHNPFYVMTPAAYEACFDQRVPVVQTIHNYRFLCAAATFYRHGKVCEECLQRGRWAGVWHRCWKGSAAASWMLTRLVDEYRWRNILGRVSRFIVLSQFSYDKFRQAGWPQARMVIKPNSLEVDGGEQNIRREPFVLYAGALQPYKGVEMLLSRWHQVLPDVRLCVVGSGPMEPFVKRHAVGNIEFLGQQSRGEVLRLMRSASCLVLPSEVYENCPMTVIEAYASGLPVAASRLGALAEMVVDGETGLLFRPGDAGDMADKISQIMNAPSLRERLSMNARQCFAQRYSVDLDCRRLVDIYRAVLAEPGV